MNKVTIEKLQLDSEISRAEIQRSLGRIEGKLDSVVSSLISHTVDDKHNFAELNKQVDAMQVIIYKSLGVITFLAITIPAAIAYLK